MIIFYNKKTGKIVGNIEGRIHKDHMNMWVGDRSITDRIVCEWIKVGDDMFEPEIQKDIFKLLDNREIKLSECSVDINTGNLYVSTNKV
jgi:hypothetical protein